MRKIFAIFGSKFILRFTYSTKNARIQKIVNELGFALFSLNFLDSDTCQIFKSELLHLCFSHFKRAKNKQNVKRHQNLSKFWLANPNQGKSKFWRLKLGGLAKSLVWPAPNCKAKSACVCCDTPRPAKPHLHSVAANLSKTFGHSPVLWPAGLQLVFLCRGTLKFPFDGVIP